MIQPAAGQPWQCPACSVWLAPHVNEHRCDPGGAVPAKTGGGGGAAGPSQLSTAIYTSPQYLGGATATSTTGTVYWLGSAA
jgi:hypothetical protein